MLLSNGEMIKNDVIESFNKAVANDENVREDGAIVWSFVDADMHMDLRAFYDADYISECMEVLADHYEGV